MRLLGEPGAGASCVDELAVFVITEQQSSDTATLVGELGEAADHELLFVNALQFQPVPAAARVIWAGGSLADDSLGPQFACPSEDRFAVRLEMLAEAHGAIYLSNHLGENRLAVDERKPAQIVAGEV